MGGAHQTREGDGVMAPHVAMMPPHGAACIDALRLADAAIERLLLKSLVGLNVEMVDVQDQDSEDDLSSEDEDGDTDECRLETHHQLSLVMLELEVQCMCHI